MNEFLLSKQSIAICIKLNSSSFDALVMPDICDIENMIGELWLQIRNCYHK